MLFRLLTQPIRQQVRQQAQRAPTMSCFYTTTTTNAATNTYTSGSSASQFADSVSKKFIAKNGQVGRRGNTPSKFLVVDNLPLTATTEDVKKLAREAFTQGDKCMNEIIFCRNKDFKFFGRCVIMMDSPESAQKLLSYGRSRLVGGQSIKMVFAGDESTANPNDFINKTRRHELLSKADATSAAGRSVIFSGLPIRTKRDQVLGILRTKNLFPVESAPDSVLQLRTKERSTVSKFLIKLDSEAEAWRCVRSFHNTDFNFKGNNLDYRLSVSVAY
ncbi:hypothetical protein [Absidia glauca]|uniref:RRM domain-containing protein n=1 Tax=Absidia glauca TaxID=4829 RepID=A0A168SED8_ABSGL|nr:hypothetical protein [Absidia glauca]